MDKEHNQKSDPKPRPGGKGRPAIAEPDSTNRAAVSSARFFRCAVFRSELLREAYFRRAEIPRHHARAALLRRRIRLSNPRIDYRAPLAHRFRRKSRARRGIRPPVSRSKILRLRGPKPDDPPATVSSQYGRRSCRHSKRQFGRRRTVAEDRRK